MKTLGLYFPKVFLYICIKENSMYIKQKWLRNTLKVIFAPAVYLWCFIALVFGVIAAGFYRLSNWMTWGKISDIIDDMLW